MSSLRPTAVSRARSAPSSTTCSGAIELFLLVLGLETSCDETAAAVVEDGAVIRSNIISSQVLVHAEYGGVVPEVASRQHLATVVKVVRQALAVAEVRAEELDGIAATCGPGLVGPLLIGVELAKAMAYALGTPMVGVNHLAGHLAAVFLDREQVATALPSPRAPGFWRTHGALSRRGRGQHGALGLDP